MANRNSRLPQNVDGPFYITSDCIDCDMCRELAASTFKRNDEIGYTVVYQQPRSEEDHRQAFEAMRSCPVEAIGDDGESQS